VVVASEGEGGVGGGAAAVLVDLRDEIICEHGAQAISRRSREGRLGAMGSRGRGWVHLEAAMELVTLTCALRVWGGRRTSPLHRLEAQRVDEGSRLEPEGKH
jgi:hypothetical protein